MRRNAEDDEPSTEEPEWRRVPAQARFTPRYRPRHREQNDAQYQASRRDAEYYARTLGVSLRIYQRLCTLRGHHRACSIPLCRRLKECAGRRPPDDWTWFVQPIIPPCVPLEEIVEELRAQFRRAVADALARLGPEVGSEKG